MQSVIPHLRNSVCICGIAKVPLGSNLLLKIRFCGAASAVEVRICGAESAATRPLLLSSQLLIVVLVLDRYLFGCPHLKMALMPLHIFIMNFSFFLFFYFSFWKSSWRSSGTLAILPYAASSLLIESANFSWDSACCFWSSTYVFISSLVQYSGIDQECESPFGSCNTKSRMETS